MISKALKKYRSMPVQAKASIWFVICSFLQKGISVITTPIFTRLLNKFEYGRYNTFNSWLSIVSVIITLNLYSGVYTQGLIKYSDDRKAYSSSLQGLCLTLVLIWTGVYAFFHTTINSLFSLTTVQMLAMLIMIWASAAFNFWSVEQRVEYRYKALVVATLIVSLAKPIVSIIFVVLADDKVTARILGLAFVEIVAYTGFFAVQMKRGKTFYSKKFWKHALMFNLPLVPHYISQTVLSSSDRIMIDKMIGPDAAGIYSLAYSLSLMMTLFNQSLTRAIEPWLYSEIRAGREKNIAPVVYPCFILIAILNILLMAFAPEIVAVFAPAEYYEAIYVIPPVTMSVYFMFMYTFYAVFEFHFEKTKYTMVATTAGAALNVLLNFVFIKRFGYIAAGYTTLVCYILYAAFHYIAMQRLYDKNVGKGSVYNLKIILAITGAFMGVGFLFLISYYNFYLRYMLILLIIAILFIKRKKLTEVVKSLINVKG